MNSPIKIYTTNWCPDCFRTKGFLKLKGIAYEEVNIERDPEAARLVMTHNGGKRRVPTLEIDGKFYGNPGLGELAEALGVTLW